MDKLWDQAAFEKSLLLLISAYQQSIDDASGISREAKWNKNLKVVSEINLVEFEDSISEAVMHVEDRLRSEVEAILMLQGRKSELNLVNSYFNYGIVLEQFKPSIERLVERFKELRMLAIQLDVYESNHRGFWGFLRGFGIAQSNAVDGVYHAFGKGASQEQYKVNRKLFVNLCIELASISDQSAQDLAHIVLNVWNTKIDEILKLCMEG